jgi:hypothetical protein
MLSRFSNHPVAFTATELFDAAVWVLRSLAVVATLFVAAVVVSWVIPA